MKRILFTIIFLSISCKGHDNELYQLRMNMIETQIKKRGITDQTILDAMKKVNRHEYVQENFERLAYSDRPVPIGFGQTISQPYIVAFMSHKLNVASHHKVLEIGTGSGYQAAVLAELSDHVYTIEIIPELAKRAEKVLKKNDYDNITIRIGDGYKGWPEHAPFDRIMVTAAPKEIPEKLVEQLAPGGIMVLPVGETVMMQYLWLITKDNDGQIEKEKILPVRFVPMVKK
jgi:protein-L-isoaspartate(D-aspartate) O-methyltransferase|tara:strand:- start:264 stop:953 length:690 start_codon:yes stop_codon:yes gene_type:complete